MTDSVNTDIDTVLEVLNEKADRDLNNSSTMEDYVVEYQMPTADNSYTWYRLYKSGWIEQGGICSDVAVGGATKQVILPRTMENSSYTITFSPNSTNGYNAGEAEYRVMSISTTSFYFYNNAGTVTSFRWLVCGIAASS